MYIIASDCIVSVELADVVYIPESGVLRLERAGTCYDLRGAPDNALQQVAEGIAEGKRFIEFEEAELVLGEEG